ncbi:phytanoyl-CoA dioxygenase family protein [Marinobacterium jannaschii]|uniref:phytanoyl-CoA dioxygenase family protein n=1 Tax=Marinobacterium jannaschii TaxID=64970 RepID=UPI0004813D56|nr:phytanoyl-CoA dioxygenase family protein [Marinobacterium jannaschii]
MGFIANDSITGFMLKKLDYKLKCRLTKHQVQPENRNALSTLQRDGCIVFPQYFSDQQLDSFEAGIAAAKARESADTIKNGHIDTGISRIFDLTEVAPATNAIFSDPMVVDLIKGYCSSECRLLKTFYEEKTEIGVPSQSNNTHFDDWRHRVKVWVYLTDVTEQQAPTTIFLGSHKDHWWRLWHEYNYYLHFRTDENNQYTPLTDYSGMFWPHEVETIRKRWHYREQAITGKRGTMFIFDSRALHRSTVLQQGERKIITGYYTFNGLGL